MSLAYLVVLIFFHFNYWLPVIGIVCYKASVTAIRRKHLKKK